MGSEEACGGGAAGDSSTSESAYILRMSQQVKSGSNNIGCSITPGGPKLKRRLARPRPDEIIIVDAEEDEDDESEGRGGVGQSVDTEFCEVLRLQAVGVSAPVVFTCCCAVDCALPVASMKVGQAPGLRRRRRCF